MSGRILASLLGGLVLPGAVLAQSILLDPAYITTFDLGFNDLGPQDLTQPAYSGPAYYHQFDVQMQLQNVAADEDFWVAFFDLNLGPGLTAADLGAGKWNPPGTNYDPNGGAPGPWLTHWQNGTADEGADNNDLRAVKVEAAAGEAGNRQYGEQLRPGAGSADALGFPTVLGSVYVQWDGSFTELSVQPIAGSSWGTYPGNDQGAGTPTAYPDGFQGGSFSFGAVPEPSTLVLTALGLLGMGLFAWRRRKR